MKPEKDVVAVLNRQLTQMLSTINQYFLHSRMLKNWGINEFAEAEYKKSIRDMKHADILIQRIFFLEGLPNLQSLEKIHVGESVDDIINCNLTVERDRNKNLKAAIKHCEEVHDYVSRDILEDLTDENEEQIDWLETQLEQIEQMGLQRYIQSMVEELNDND